MEEMFENKMLDEIYELRGEGFIRAYINKYGKPDTSKKSEKAEEKLVNFMKNFIQDEQEIEKLIDLLNSFESYVLDEMCFWHKPYYKLGFIDGMSLKNEIRKEKIAESFSDKEDNIYDKFEDIWDYVDKIKYDNLKSNEEYNNTKKELIEIYSKYPKVEEFIYDEKIEKFTEEELKAISQVINIYNLRFTLEEEEMLKIGVKIGKSL